MEEASVASGAFVFTPTLIASPALSLAALLVHSSCGLGTVMGGRGKKCVKENSLSAYSLVIHDY